MSRQNKQRAKKALNKSGKGHNAGADKHFTEGAVRSRYPGQQPAPRWLKHTVKKGWWLKGHAPKAGESQAGQAGV